MTIRLNEEERRLIRGAAAAEGRACAAYAADAAVAAARGDAHVRTGPLREALKELMDASGQLHRVGTNLNQAVRHLNATGRPPEPFARIAESCAQAADRVDAAAEAVRNRLP